MFFLPCNRGLSDLRQLPTPTPRHSTNSDRSRCKLERSITGATVSSDSYICIAESSLLATAWAPRMWPTTLASYPLMQQGGTCTYLTWAMTEEWIRIAWCFRAQAHKSKPAYFRFLRDHECLSNVQHALAGLPLVPGQACAESNQCKRPQGCQADCQI